MKSLIKIRRENNAICNICKSPDYKELPAYFNGGKLNYECNQCGHSWQYGKDGGKYHKFKEVKDL